MYYFKKTNPGHLLEHYFVSCGSLTDAAPPYVESIMIIMILLIKNPDLVLLNRKGCVN